MFSESAEDAVHILLCDHADDLDIRSRNSRRAGAEDFFDDGIVDLPLSLLHEHFPDRQSTLIGTELLGVHLSGLRSTVYHIQHIHRAVADIGN